ncbi:hypothetical protein RRG08_006598, partial [Elysia crispata]
LIQRNKDVQQESKPLTILKYSNKRDDRKNRKAKIPCPYIFVSSFTFGTAAQIGG